MVDTACCYLLNLHVQQLVLFDSTEKYSVDFEQCTQDFRTT
jgi:hypothetical protein